MKKTQKIKIPSKIKILGREFKIKKIKNISYQGTPVLGLIDYDAAIIYLEKQQTPAVMRATLIHECAHGLMIISGMDQRLSESENEMYCQLLTAFYEDVEKALS
jgi:hypothetical protein